jgi:hypothetical protein
MSKYTVDIPEDMTINEVFAIAEAYLLEIVKYLEETGEGMTIPPIRKAADEVNMLYRELFPRA